MGSAPVHDPAAGSLSLTAAEAAASSASPPAAKNAADPAAPPSHRQPSRPAAWEDSELEPTKPATWLERHTLLPASAGSASRQRQGSAAASGSDGATLSAVRGQVQAVAVSLCLLALVHLNAVLWADYIGLMLWAFVLSEALRTGRERYLNALRQLHVQLLQHDDGGLVYWMLQVAGARSLAKRWFRVLTKEKARASPLKRTTSAKEPRRHVTEQVHGAPQITAWRVFRACAREQWNGEAQAQAQAQAQQQANTQEGGGGKQEKTQQPKEHNLRLERCTICLRRLWRICMWPFELFMHVATAATHTSLVSLSLFLTLHLFPASTLWKVACFAIGLPTILLASLAMLGLTRTILAPVVRTANAKCNRNANFL